VRGTSPGVLVAEDRTLGGLGFYEPSKRLLRTSRAGDRAKLTRAGVEPLATPTPFLISAAPKEGVAAERNDTPTVVPKSCIDGTADNLRTNFCPIFRWSYRVLFHL
jgi:hypothetical protein